MNYDYAIHSDFLIHWTGKDIDQKYAPQWHVSDKSETNSDEICECYLKRLHDILKFGLWMTEENIQTLSFGNFNETIPATPKTCFTELKVSESRKHACQYGRLGIGVKRPFVFDRFGRPLIYYGFHKDIHKDKFLETCASEIKNKNMLNFFKPMNSTKTLDYDFYSESEWRIIYFEELLSLGSIIDPRDKKNEDSYKYFCGLKEEEQVKLKYLIPLNGWFAMIIYPSLAVKNKAQQDESDDGIKEQIKRIKNKLHFEGKNWPIEIDLDACRNF